MKRFLLLFFLPILLDAETAPVPVDVTTASPATAISPNQDSNVLIARPALPNVAALEGVTGMVNGERAATSGYYAPNDGGAAIYVYDAAGGAKADGGAVIAPNSGKGRWCLQSSGALNVRQFGARGNSTSDDSTVIGNAYKAAKAAGGGLLFFPAGSYRCNATISARDNVSFLGVPGSTIFIPASHEAVFTVTGYALVQNKIYFKNFEILGTENISDQGFYLNGTSVAIENVQIKKVGICCYINAALGSDFTRCRFYGINYGFVEKGSALEYSGFNVFDDVEIQAGKCGIYKDNTAGQGNGGGDDFRKVLFEGVPGIFFYGNSASEYATPDFFHDVWLEDCAKATLLDLSDVGGPPSLNVEGNACFFINSSAHIDWMTYPFRAANNSTIRVKQYENERGTSWSTDATSFAMVDSVTTGTLGLAIPFVVPNLIPYAGRGITALGGFVRDSLDYSQVNLLGATGDGCANFAETGSAGTACSIVEDDTAPVFNKVLSLAIPAAGTVTLYTYTTSSEGEKYMNQTAGRWYVYSYYIKILAGNGKIGPDWVNILPLESNLPQNVWNHVAGIFFCATTNSNRHMLVRNEGGMTARFELSQFQVVEFADGGQARAFMNSGRYAASYPGATPTPRYNLVQYKQRAMSGRGAPTANALFVGQEYLDTTGNKWYKATATGTGSSDWLRL